MELLPIHEKQEDNEAFINDPLCRDSIYRTLDFYKRVGFAPPWIGYYAKENGNLVGCAAFKGRPSEGKVEIAYGTFEAYQKQGVGIRICSALVDLSRQTDPSVSITARTLPEENFSTKILQKNNFRLLGTVEDPEDGPVWEWLFEPVNV